jgi:hypothetical protein
MLTEILFILVFILFSFGGLCYSCLCVFKTTQVLEYFQKKSPTSTRKQKIFDLLRLDYRTKSRYLKIAGAIGIFSFGLFLCFLVFRSFYPINY